MTTEVEQKILTALGDLQNNFIDLRGEVTDLRGEMSDLRGEVTDLRGEMVSNRSELKEEVNRWDDRFFQSTRDFRNLALSLITSATIAVIVGMILLIIKR